MMMSMYLAFNLIERACVLNSTISIAWTGVYLPAR